MKWTLNEFMKNNNIKDEYSIFDYDTPLDFYMGYESETDYKNALDNLAFDDGEMALNLESHVWIYYSNLEKYADYYYIEANTAIREDYIFNDSAEAFEYFNKLIDSKFYHGLIDKDSEEVKQYILENCKSL